MSYFSWSQMCHSGDTFLMFSLMAVEPEAGPVLGSAGAGKRPSWDLGVYGLKSQ